MIAFPTTTIKKERPRESRGGHACQDQQALFRNRDMLSVPDIDGRSMDQQALFPSPTRKVGTILCSLVRSRTSSPAGWMAFLSLLSKAESQEATDRVTIQVERARGSSEITISG
jgi:hypothetical protein